MLNLFPALILRASPSSSLKKIAIEFFPPAGSMDSRYILPTADSGSGPRYMDVHDLDDCIVADACALRLFPRVLEIWRLSSFFRRCSGLRMLYTVFRRRTASIPNAQHGKEAAAADRAALNNLTPSNKYAQAFTYVTPPHARKTVPGEGLKS